MLRKHTDASLYHQAFTLVELAVAISVVGILTVLSFVTYDGWQERTARAALLSDIANAASQLEVDRQRDGGFPENEAAIDGGRGFSLSEGVTLRYFPIVSGSGVREDDGYCLVGETSRPDVASHIITSDNSTPREGNCDSYSNP